MTDYTTAEYIRVVIDVTDRAAAQEAAKYSHRDEETFKTIEEVREFLTDRYGKLPSGRRKIYQDTAGGSAEVVGFLHTFWNRNDPYSSKARLQTDWVSITDVRETVRRL